MVRDFWYPFSCALNFFSFAFSLFLSFSQKSLIVHLYSFRCDSVQFFALPFFVSSIFSCCFKCSAVQRHRSGAKKDSLLLILFRFIHIRILRVCMFFSLSLLFLHLSLSFSLWPNINTERFLTLWPTKIRTIMRIIIMLSPFSFHYTHETYIL